MKVLSQIPRRLLPDFFPTSLAVVQPARQAFSCIDWDRSRADPSNPHEAKGVLR